MVLLGMHKKEGELAFTDVALERANEEEVFRNQMIDSFRRTS